MIEFGRKSDFNFGFGCDFLLCPEGKQVFGQLALVEMVWFNRIKPNSINAQATANNQGKENDNFHPFDLCYIKTIIIKLFYRA